MFKRIDHIEIIPRDVQKTIEFYTQVLNFRIKERKKLDAGPLQEVIYLDLNDTVIELLSVQGASAPSEKEWQVGYRMIALEVPDMHKAIQYLQSKGVAPSRGPVNLGTSMRAEIRDPSGLPIELRQW